MREVAVMILAAGLTSLGGCTWGDADVSPAGPDDPPTVGLRFHVADAEQHEGYTGLRDERGQPLYIDPSPFLTDADICDAAAMIGDRSNMLALEFCPLAAEHFERVARDHRQRRLAVFVDGKLILSPAMPSPSTTGRIILDGGFSRKRAQELARGLNAQRASMLRSRRGPNQ
jgi:preprotein translocase subunit SecD